MGRTFENAYVTVIGELIPSVIIWYEKRK